MSFICPECNSDYTTNIGCGIISCEYCGLNFAHPFLNDSDLEDDEEENDDEIYFDEIDIDEIDLDF